MFTSLSVITLTLNLDLDSATIKSKFPQSKPKGTKAERRANSAPPSPERRAPSTAKVTIPRKKAVKSRTKDKNVDSDENSNNAPSTKIQGPAISKSKSRHIIVDSDDDPSNAKKQDDDEDGDPLTRYLQMKEEVQQERMVGHLF
jgi:hypothetical protein